jgi:uncharacterized protein YPO0396
MMTDDATNRVRYADLPSPIDEQFRASRLSVWNWGTFSRRHTVDIAWEGHLLLGPSGAGKSTLQDAMSALLVPPQKVRFNAAAEEGERGGRDRTLMSYVRGAWADRSEEGSRETAKQFLRGDATWSAVALEYRNKRGRVVTLVRIMWVRGAGTSANLNKHFIVVEGEFDLAELKDFDGERRTLRQKLRLPGLRHHDESFAAFQEHWCRIFGIEDASVLDLLHKTQSTKSLGDLNSFLREFMLAEPDTFEKAQALVDEFIDLEEAHRAVVTARRQIEALAPARSAHEEHAAAGTDIVGNDALLEALPAFRYSLEVGLLGAEYDALVRGRVIAIAEREQIAEELRLTDEAIQGLERRRTAEGGGSIAEIEARIVELTDQRGRRTNTRERLQLACRALGWELAEDAAGFAAQADQARALIEASDRRLATRAEEEGNLAVARHEQEKAFTELRREVANLEEHPSNIPRRAQDLRRVLCEALNIAPAKVAFVGELIQVREADRTEWAPAAEHLLRAFALDLLIDEDDDRRVARWVDETKLGQRIVYHPVSCRQQPAAREPEGPDSIVNKLEVKPGSLFGPWVRRELTERFDYRCMSSPAELTRGEKRITAQGQIRHARRRTVKDDSLNLHDKRNWVLGFDNRDKLARLRELTAEAGAALAVTEQAIDALVRERQGDLLRIREAQAVAVTDWSDIDVATLARRIGQLEGDLERVRRGSPGLAQVEGELAEARGRRKAQNQAWAERKVLIDQANEREPTLTAELQRARIETAGLAAVHAAALRERLPSEWTPTRSSVAETLQAIASELGKENRKLAARMASLAGAITAAFATFLREWPEEVAALQADLAFAPDFFAKLQRIEDDGLPQHEARFLDLLQKQSTQRLAELSQLLIQAKREIVSKLVDVNDALRLVRYNSDSYLEIESIDLNLPDVKEFRDTLGVLFEGQRNQSDDQAEAERRFEVLRDLVERLQTDETWRSTVLDVRRHVQFKAVEREHGSGVEIETHSGSSGRSGGQRQKLTATCLAAALRFKLGGVDGGVPSYGTVVLDEAFTKTDNEFTATSMKIFTELGFQMIVATPLKSVMTLEPFVGGATFVSIANRHTSSVLNISYDHAAQRLDWADSTRAALSQAAVADETA